jgi:hypothetical protein
MSVRREQPVEALTARPVGLAQQQPLGTALGAAPRRSIPALRSPVIRAALAADSWGGPWGVIQGCYPRRVALALMSEEAERHPRSCALPSSRFPEITRVIVYAQSQKRPRCVGKAK